MKPSSDSSETLMGLQQRFAGTIRNPVRVSAPEDVSARRMNVYRELFFNNFVQNLSSAFPVLSGLYDASRWRRLVEGFFAEHPARTPYFNRLPGEFVDYLWSRYDPQPEDPPFLTELAQWEWAELELLLAPDAETGDAIPDHLTECRPVLSPLARVFCYRYPVHRIGEAFQPVVPEAVPTYLLAYRDGEGRVQFLELNAVTYTLLETLGRRGDHTLGEVLTAIAENLPGADPEVVHRAGLETVVDLLRRGVLQDSSGA